MQRGLKYKVVTSFMVLLFFGMILIDLVVVSFWQRDLVRAEVERGKIFLQMYSHLPYADYKKTRTKLQKIIKTDIGNSWDCFESIAVFMKGRLSFFPLNERDEYFLNMVKLASSDKEERVHYFGRAWTVLGVGYRYVGLVSPLEVNSYYPASIGILISLRPVYKHILEKQKSIFIYLFVNMVILSVLGLFRMVKYFIKPLENVVALSEAYNEIDHIVFSSETDGDEFHKLAVSLNAMMKKIEDDRDRLKSAIQTLETTNQKLIESRAEVVTKEKMAAVGVLSAGMAHEIGNPLSIIQGYFELLKNGQLELHEREDFATRGLKELSRVDELIRQLLLFSRSNRQTEDNGEISEILKELQARVIVHNDLKSIDYSQEIEVQGKNYIHGRTALMQVLLNCILNAKDAVLENGSREKWIKLFCCVELNNNGRKSVRISIEDNGTGISKDALPKVFDPFFTTKEPGRGTGLGLSVSYALIAAIQGDIRVESEEGKGTIFHIVLPAFTEQ